MVDSFIFFVCLLCKELAASALTLATAIVFYENSIKNLSEGNKS